MYSKIYELLTLGASFLTPGMASSNGMGQYLSNLTNNVHRDFVDQFGNEDLEVRLALSTKDNG